jgi:hypothetical protein
LGPERDNAQARSIPRRTDHFRGEAGEVLGSLALRTVIRQAGGQVLEAALTVRACSSPCRGPARISATCRTARASGSRVLDCRAVVRLDEPWLADSRAGSPARFVPSRVTAAPPAPAACRVSARMGRLTTSRVGEDYQHAGNVLAPSPGSRARRREAAAAGRPAAAVLSGVRDAAGSPLPPPAAQRREARRRWARNGGGHGGMSRLRTPPVRRVRHARAPAL